MQGRALRLLLLEARERDHFYSNRALQQMVCPRAGCDAHFTVLGEWTSHALQEGHDRDQHLRYHVLTEWGVEHRLLPSIAFKDDVSRHTDRIQTIIRDEIRAPTRHMLHTWRSDDPAVRLAARQAYAHQLTHDPLYFQGCPVEESRSWDLLIGLLDRECHD